MKRILWGVIVCLLAFNSAGAKDFESTLILGKHNTKNHYGEWHIDKKRANTAQFHAKIITDGKVHNLASTTPGIDISDIEIIDIPFYKKVFVDKDYYQFYWRKKENKGYFDANANKINVTISSIPPVFLRIKNSSGESLNLQYIENRNIFQKGGMADFVARNMTPQVKKGAMEISYNTKDRMTFPKSYLLPAGKTVILPLSLWVKNAAHGDGSGELAYALEMHYTKDGENKNEVLLNVLQADAEGYDMGAIAPAN